MYRDLAVFSGSANPDLAREICDYLDTPLRGMDIIDFPNENIFIKLHRSVRGQDVYVIQSACSPVNRNVMELLIIIDTLRRASAEQITAVMPLYPYARSDKKDQPRVPITARLIADLITVAGANRYMTIDLHAGQIQGFFTIPGDELTAFHILSEYFLKRNIPNAVVVSPDLGFAKKARNFAEKLHIPLAVIEKRRKSPMRPEALNVIGDVRGKNAILVDDEVLTAGTVVEAVDVLKSRGVDRSFISFTHAILTDPATERLRSLPLEEIVTTNTVAIPPEKRLPNMIILSVAPLLGEVIRRTHLGISVGEMFNE